MEDRRGQVFAQVNLMNGRSKIFQEQFSVVDLAEREARGLFEMAALFGIAFDADEKKDIRYQLIDSITELRAASNAKRHLGRLLALERGWNGPHFVSPYTAHQGTKQKVILGTPLAARAMRLAHRADLDEFHKALRAQGHGNALFKFCMSIPFLAPLLELIAGREIPMFVLVGPSVHSKLTMLKAMTSIFGGDRDGGLDPTGSGYIPTNGSKHLGAYVRDSFVPIGELENVAQTATQRLHVVRKTFMTMHCSGDKLGHGQLRTVVATASTGKLAVALSQAAPTALAAMGVWPIELPCDGVDELPSAIVEVARSTVGIAGEAFLQRLVRDRAQDPAALHRKLARWKAMMEARWVTPEMDDRDRCSIGIFAQVFAASCLAHEYGVLPWNERRLLRAFGYVLTFGEVLVDHFELRDGQRPLVAD